MRMPEDRGLKQGSGTARRAAERRRRAREKANGAADELSPERRVELTQQIKARRSRGKPPSI
jgi:hypothetical protein